VTRILANAMTAPNQGAAALTTREREVVSLIGAGQSNREISHTLGISERTVYTHTGNVLSKLGLASRTQAALWAVREGLAKL
jgi:DNA-binding NarL/FixJ family response regulator